MILRKNIKIFSAVFLTFVVLLSNNAVLSHINAQKINLFNITVSAEDGQQAGETENAPPADNSTIYAFGGIGPEYALASDAIFVYNTNENRLVYSKNANKKIWPASTTKIMTTLAVLESGYSLDEVLTVPSIAFDEFWGNNPNTYGASNAALEIGQKNLTTRDALYGLMLRSGCDAANVLAYNVGGVGMDDGDKKENAIPNFIKMMNDKAKEIGCENTNFSNAHGLFDENNYTTVEDLFKITKYALDTHSNFFRALVATDEYAMPPNSNNPSGHTIYNSNLLSRESSEYSYFYEPAAGVKTGGFDVYHTKIDPEGGWGEANRNNFDGIANLVSIASDGRFEYLVVTVGAPWLSQLEAGQHQQHYAFKDHKALYDWAFSSFDNRVVLEKDEPKGQVEITNGKKDKINLYPELAEDKYAFLPLNYDIKDLIADSTDKKVEAPVKKGQIIDTVSLKIANEVIGEPIPLVTREKVDKTQASVAVGKIESIVKSWWFVPLVIVIAILVIALIVLNYIRVYHKGRDRAFSGGGARNSRNSKNKKKRNNNIRR